MQTSNFIQLIKKPTSACSVIAIWSCTPCRCGSTVPGPIKVIILSILNPATIAQLKITGDIVTKQSWVSIDRKHCDDRKYKGFVSCIFHSRLNSMEYVTL